MLVLGHIFLLSLLPDLPFTLTPLIAALLFPCQISTLLKAEAGRHIDCVDQHKLPERGDHYIKVKE